MKGEKLYFMTITIHNTESRPNNIVDRKTYKKQLKLKSIKRTRVKQILKLRSNTFPVVSQEH